MKDVVPWCAISMQSPLAFHLVHARTVSCYKTKAKCCMCLGLVVELPQATPTSLLGLKPMLQGCLSDLQTIKSADGASALRRVKGGYTFMANMLKAFS